MRTMFGYFCRDDRPLAPFILERMQAASTNYCETSCEYLKCDGVGLGWQTDSSAAVSNTLGSPDEQLFFIATGRVDNSRELGKLLQVPSSELAFMNDYELIRRAYQKWGSDCSVRIIGDWSYAAWHQDTRQLILSRDHHGYTSLFYYCDVKTFAFASSRNAILALGLTPVEIDELYIAQYLISWMAYQGERTCHKNIYRLPPSHSLHVTPIAFDINRYWRMEDVSEVRMKRRDDYVEAFTQLFDEAVYCRLSDEGKTAVTLSGGLDSSSVAAVAARFRSNNGQRLTAFTSIPISDTANYTKDRFGDELSYAQSTARFAGNIDLYPLDSKNISPIAGIRRIVQLGLDPMHCASNLYWLTDIWQSTSDHSCKVLLTGALGNGGVSWPGNILSQTLSFWLLHVSWQTFLKEYKKQVSNRIKLAIPSDWLSFAKRNVIRQDKWCRWSTIHPDFAKRIHLLEMRLNDCEERPARTPLEQRFNFFKPGRSIGGAIEAEIGEAYGLEIRDPTADVRLLKFTLSVPDHIFMDPVTGMDRWLIREAMKSRLPEDVRLNRNRGRQSGDMVPRLRASAKEVEVALDELARGPAAEYVDVSYMRQLWRMIQTEDSNEAFVKSITIFSRGIMAGLFVNHFYE